MLSCASIDVKFFLLCTEWNYVRLCPTPQHLIVTCTNLEEGQGVKLQKICLGPPGNL